jgi:hypothetical protein
MNTNFTVTGHDFLVSLPNGTLIQDVPFALVQWEAGYDPAVHPLTEWTGNPIMVSWTGWYVKDYSGVGQGIFGSNGTMTGVNSPLFMFIDFGSSANPTPEMYNKVWMGQITDSLVLSGESVVIDLNSANIRSVVGSNVGNILIAQDFNTWTPQAVPEPSYSALAVALFAGAVLWKKLTSPKKEAQ